MNAEELEKLHQLKEKGILSEDEFTQAKAKLIAGQSSFGDKIDKALADISTDITKWSMFLHLSQLLGFAIPVLGWCVPVLMWMGKRDSSPVIDEHGKNVINWILSQIVMGVGCAILSIIWIGIPLAFILLLLGVVFPVMGAFKAKEGRIWRYPCTFQFLK